MNIFNKIKVNYNLKLLDDFVSNNNKEEIFTLLNDTKIKNKELFFQLLNHFIDKYKNHSIVTISSKIELCLLIVLK